MNRLMTHAICGCLALATVLAGCDKPDQAPRSDDLANPSARPAPMASTKAPPALADKDQAFIAEAAGDNAFQIAMGRLALQKSRSTDVRQFAQKIIDDHTRMNNELAAISERRGNNPYSAAVPVDRSRQMQDKLGAQQGTAFDHAFAGLMVDDHQSAIDRFAAEMQNGHDDALRAFADRELPTLREHLAMAKALNDGRSESASK
jgi:putative membrane protein